MTCVFAVVVFAIISSTVWFIRNSGYNEIQGQDENVKAQWAEVQNQYKRRNDLIGNLVSVVKGYATHEKTTLENVISARYRSAQANKTGKDAINNPEDFKKFQKTQDNLTSALSRLLLVYEQYPNLKADQHFVKLQDQIETTENSIAEARNNYIASVNTYNKYIRYLPTSITAKYILGLKLRPTFEYDNDKAPVIDFKD